MTKVTRLVQIRKTNVDEKIVYGVVYEPMALDTGGEFMFPEDIRKMAHSFMQLELSKVIDTNHDNVPNGSYPIESFIARAGDPDYPEGAWVMGVKCSDTLWGLVQKGEINAFSFEAMVVPLSVEVEVANVRDRVGFTEKSEKQEADHEHVFFVQTDALGRVVRGWTDTVNGHSHTIKHGCRTEKAADHNHRFFF